MFAELCLVTFCSVGEAGYVVCMSCLEGCGSQSNIGLFLIQCCLIHDTLDGTSSGILSSPLPGDNHGDNREGTL